MVNFQHSMLANLLPPRNPLTCRYKYKKKRDNIAQPYLTPMLQLISFDQPLLFLNLIMTSCKALSLQPSTPSIINGKIFYEINKTRQ